MKTAIYSVFLILILAFAACSKDSNDELPQNFAGYSYLPLSVGEERIYKVDSIAYDDFTGTIDTVVYFLKERIQSEFQDLGGRKSYKVDIYQRSSDTLAWKQLRTDVRHRGVYRYELTQNGISTTPLVFPPLKESRWNVNSLNSGEEIVYRYQNLHQAFQSEERRFDSTITVLQKDQISLIGKEVAKEVYGSQLGLVYRESTKLQTDINTGQIVSGSERYQRLIKP